MESTFSSPAEAALQREAGDPALLTPVSDLDQVYELERVAAFIGDLDCPRVRVGDGSGYPVSPAGGHSSPPQRAGHPPPARPRLHHGLYSQVALQFPDRLLGDARAVATRLEEATGSKMFILGDTAYGRCGLGISGHSGLVGLHRYWLATTPFPTSHLQPQVRFHPHPSSSYLPPGTPLSSPIPFPTDDGRCFPCSCCVDVLGAEQAGAQALVHFGPACLSPPSRPLPIAFVLGHRPVALELCAKAFETQYPDTTVPVALLSEPACAHAMGEASACACGEKGQARTQGARSSLHFGFSCSLPGMRSFSFAEPQY